MFTNGPSLSLCLCVYVHVSCVLYPCADRGCLFTQVAGAA